MNIKYNKNHTPLAKDLRHNMTKEEKHLWYDFLSTYPIRFKKQKVIGNYIVDFYCNEAKLVVELDGSQHFIDNGIINDEYRTIFLNKLGIKVIRISNFDINVNFEGACRYINDTICEILGRDVYLG